MDQCQVHGVMRSFMSPNTDVLVPIQTNATSHHDGNVHDLEKVKNTRQNTRQLYYLQFRYGGTCLPDWLL